MFYYYFVYYIGKIFITPWYCNNINLKNACYILFQLIMILTYNLLLYY